MTSLWWWIKEQRKAAKPPFFVPSLNKYNLSSYVCTRKETVYKFEEKIRREKRERSKTITCH